MEKKGKLMNLHKSFGLLMFGLIVPRVAARLTTKIPAHLPGPGWEILAGKLSHYALYGGLIFMPTSGVLMSYLNGRGIPFFKWHIPGLPKEKAAKYEKVSSKLFWAHHYVGIGLEYLIPLHVGAVGYHYLFRGQNLLARMNPFTKI
eukprot:TRINITY_DN4188_c0_g1_i3.p1 TRINITY_DN4188_c0_g1~~TRINITY_DN4188_c0_g1_i3.p1  ORF type:complete len:146 (+),score=40.63 TRINITY_DN4188_c0_g1_i3:567-1004(+)